MKKAICLITLIFYIVNTFAQQRQRGTYTDTRDGQIYETVLIGTQVWMAENLNFETPKGSWCYSNDTSNCNKYGRLYNWKTACNACPSGWHLPSQEEWEALLKYLGEKGEPAYNQIIEGGTSGFDALFGGWCDDGGYFNYIGYSTSFWSSTCGYDRAWRFYLAKYKKEASMYRYFKSYGLSVRCLRGFQF
jgi:uncharacterized protein (TIGR02145 family)